MRFKTDATPATKSRDANARQGVARHCRKCDRACRTLRHGASHSRVTLFRNRALFYSIRLWRASESRVKDARQNRKCDICLIHFRKEHCQCQGNIENCNHPEVSIIAPILVFVITVCDGVLLLLCFDKWIICVHTVPSYSGNFAYIFSACWFVVGRVQFSGSCFWCAKVRWLYVFSVFQKE